MKKLLIIAVLFALTITLHTVPNEHIRFGIPGGNGKILYREGYVLLHDPVKKIPLWVSYHLTAQDLKGTQKRTDDFRPDPDLPKGHRAELSDYYKSGFDRRFIAPVGDMTRSRKVMSESFLLSNIVPQLPGMNRGGWKVLEESVRDITRSTKDAWIITGPIFRDLDGDRKGDPLKRIGSNKVWVPTDCYKIIVYTNHMYSRLFSRHRNLIANAYIMPYISIKGTNIMYMTSIDKIESLTGLDFLNELPDDLESKIENWNNKDKIDKEFLKERMKIEKKVEEEFKDFHLTQFSGNTLSKIFHKLSCRYFNCKSITVRFKTKDQAVKAGYKPCKVCKP